ncbi:MAG: tRNA lysidine(34) synthetase TilS, partial [Myxococcota bacterium]
MLVACSGGGDSVALTRLLARLAPELGLELHVATVDHGLRAGSGREALLVAALARRLGLDHVTLPVKVAAGSLQAQARVARYAALRAHARRLGTRRIAVGHTLDDQAETVLYRALRGAGIEGLAGIAPARRDGVVRPLLDCRRAALRAHLRHLGETWVEDPSNADPRFARARLRAFWGELEAIDPRAAEHLAHLADDARAARGSLASRARRWQLRAERGGALRLSVLRAIAPAAASR